MRRGASIGRTAMPSPRRRQRRRRRRRPRRRPPSEVIHEMPTDKNTIQLIAALIIRSKLHMHTDQKPLSVVGLSFILLP
jgi:hypothetical protein